MEQVCKRQKRDSDEAKLEDLPEEIILKILSSVNIRDLFQCMAVNKKIREVANDQTLWNKMHIDGDYYDHGNGLPADPILLTRDGPVLLRRGQLAHQV